MNASGAESSRHCRLCGGASLAFLFRESDGRRHYECWRCETCEVSQTVGDFPPLSPDYVELAAEDLSGHHRFIQTTGKAGAFAQWRSLMAAHGRTAGSLLDIGCGVGGFLDFAADAGFDVYGFDASTAQAEDARVRHSHVRAAASIAAFEAVLETPLPRFDAITLWDVFEHVREPQTLLREIRGRLAPSGLLFLSVPNGRVIPSKLALARLRRRPPGLTPWEHVFYYEPASLRRIVGSSGFTVAEAGGVVPYFRAPRFADLVRRSIHRGLAKTPLALQLFVMARRLT